MDETRKRDLAWLGDAVLALYARKWLLARAGWTRGEREEAFKLMTSNQFLSGIGEPTAVEARIGELYEKSGPETAFGYIEDILIPLYEKQARNRRRAGKKKG